MDRKDLYKLNSRIVLKDKNDRFLNVRNERQEKRHNLHLTGRNISISPELEKSIEKQNIVILSKKERYYARYLKWKKDKERKIEEERKQRKKPFFCCVGNGNVSRIQAFDGLQNKNKQTLKTENNIKFNDNMKENKIQNLNVKKTANNAKQKITVPPLHLNGKECMITRSKKRKMENELKNPPPKKGAKENQLKLQKKSPHQQCLKVDFVAFDPYVTSTKRKSHSKSAIFLEESPEPSPIEALKDMSNESTKGAKKALTLSSNEKKLETRNEFNFEMIPKKPANMIIQSTINLVGNREHDVIVKKSSIQNVKTEKINFISANITTSNEKGTKRKDSIKRKSINNLSINSPIESIKIRKIRESIKLFRTVLSDETERLRKLCEVWLAYKKDWKDLNNSREYVTDMINMTIGQTNLFIDKKLRQFGDLIDECESLMKPTNKNSSNQKILPEDLEGFWSMVKLQVDNIDQRFENLDRWKNNNWNDPDEVKLKQKSKHAKKKPKLESKAKSAIADIIKKAHAKYLANRNNQSTANEDVILTPSSKKPKKSLGSTPKCSTDKRSNAARLSKGTGWLVRNNNSDSPKTPLRKNVLKSAMKKSITKNVIFNDQIDYKSPENLLPKEGEV